MENAKLRQEIKESEARTAAIEDLGSLQTPHRLDDTADFIPSELLVPAKFVRLPQRELPRTLWENSGRSISTDSAISSMELRMCTEKTESLTKAKR